MNRTAQEDEAMLLDAHRHAEVVLGRANLPGVAEEYWAWPILDLGMDKEE